MQLRHTIIYIYIWIIKTLVWAARLGGKKKCYSIFYFWSLIKMTGYVCIFPRKTPIYCISFCYLFLFPRVPFFPLILIYNIFNFYFPHVVVKIRNYTQSEYVSVVQNDQKSAFFFNTVCNKFLRPLTKLLSKSYCFWAAKAFLLWPTRNKENRL